MAHVKIEIIDENGNMVPTANESVKITVEGAGSLIGLDNGNPTDHTSMKSNERKTFNGLGLAVIQAGNKPGTIQIHASSPGVNAASVDIVVQNAGVPVKTVENIKK